MRDPDFRKKPLVKDWDSPEKSKQRLDAVRRNVAKKKAARKPSNVVPIGTKKR